MERDTGVEPATFSLGTSEETVPERVRRLQEVGIIQGEAREVVRESLDFATNSSPLVTRLLPGEPRQVLNGGGCIGSPERLISVAEVAEQLGVKPITVYRLCAKGRLTHVRVLNAIRVAPSAIAEFVGLQTRRSS